MFTVSEDVRLYSKLFSDVQIAFTRSKHFVMLVLFLAPDIETIIIQEWIIKRNQLSKLPTVVLSLYRMCISYDYLSPILADPFFY